MAIDVLVHHGHDPVRARALALALASDLRAGERLVVRTRATAATLDPARAEPGDEGHGVSGGDDASDMVAIVDADRVAPEAGALDALRRPPREWDAWTGPVLAADGDRVAAAGLGLTFLGATVPLRAGMALARLPGTPFRADVLPGALIAVRREVLEAAPWIAEGTDPDGLALAIALHLRATGGLLGVVPAARARLVPGAAPPGGRGRPAERVRAATAAYPAPVLAAAAPAAALAAPARLVRAAVGGHGREGARELSEAARAIRPAMRIRRASAAARTVDAASFADGVAADGLPAGDPAGRVGRALARAWWSSAAELMRVRRARSRRRAARSIPR